MNDKQIYTFGKIVNSLIVSMGMQALNQQRELNGESMAYTDDDFFAVAIDQEEIANMLRIQTE